MVRHVVLVTGPPCAGKTHYTQQHAKPDDLVLDRDLIPGPHPERAMRRMISQVAAMTHGTAWVIRSAPNGQARTHLAQQIRANQVLVLLPPQHVLTTRALTRPDPTATLAAISQWQRAWTPSDLDVVIERQTSITTGQRLEW